MKFDIDDLSWDAPTAVTAAAQHEPVLSAYQIGQHAGSLPMGMSITASGASMRAASNHLEGLHAINEDPYSMFAAAAGNAASTANATHFHPFSAPSGMLTDNGMHQLSASLGSNGMTPELLRHSPDDGSPDNADEDTQEGAKADDEDEDELRKRKPHKCDTCGACFARKVHLQRHSLRHITCKPYSCELCGKCFSRQDSLVRHHRLLHEREGRGKTTSSGKPLPPSAMRNRSPKACTRCSHLKTRCDGNEPCARCIAHGLGAGDCVYRPSAAQRSRSASSRVTAPSPAFVSERVLDEVESDDEREVGSKLMAANASTDSVRGRPLARFNAASNNSGSASSNGSGSGASASERQSVFSASYDDCTIPPLSPASWASNSSVGAHFAGMHLQQPQSLHAEQQQHGSQHQRSHSQQAMPTHAALSMHHGFQVNHDAHAAIQAHHAQQQAAMLGISLPQQFNFAHVANAHGMAAAGNFTPLSQSLQPSHLHMSSTGAMAQQQQHSNGGHAQSFAGVMGGLSGAGGHHHSYSASDMSGFSAPMHTSIGFAAPAAHASHNGASEPGGSMHAYAQGAFASAAAVPISGNGTTSSAPTAAELMSFDWQEYMPAAADDRHQLHAANGAKPNPFAVAAYGQSMMLAPDPASKDMEMDGTRTPNSHTAQGSRKRGSMHVESPGGVAGTTSNMHSPSYGAHDALALSQTLGDADWEAAFRGR